MTYPIQPGSSFLGSRNWLSCQTQSLWLNNAAQCKRLTGGSSIAATAWTHEETYLIYGFLAPISDQGIPVEYKLDPFNTPPQEQLYVTPKIGYIGAKPYFCSRHLALISPLGHFNEDNAHLSTRRTKLMVTPKLISFNGNMAFAKLQRTQSLACPTTCAAFSTLSYLHFVSLLTIFPTRLAAQKANPIFYAANKNYSKHILTIGILLLHPSFITLQS